MTPRALCFDLDGTIVDIKPIRLANWLEVLRPHGIEVDMDVYREKMNDRTSEEVINELLPDLSDEEKEELLEAEAGRYRSRMIEAGAIVGLHKLLEEARARGLRLALVTDTPEELARKSLKALALTDAFEPMVFAEEMGVEKPDPTAYEAALERLGISPEEALAFEDSPKGVKAAVRAGIPVVGLVSTHKPDELREAGVEFVVGDFADQALREQFDG